MFLTEKAVTPLTLLFFPSKNPLPSPFPSLPFDQALIAGLHSLLPIPTSSSSIPLSWLCRAVDFLALTLSDAAVLISDPSLSGSDRAALAAQLDSGIALLDACNAVAAHIYRLLRRHLLLRFALHLLSYPDSLRRARDVIDEWDRDRPPRRAIHDSAGMLVRSLFPGNPPRGKISAVRRAIYAVEALSSLVAGAVVAVLGGGEKGDLVGVSVSGEFPWAGAFNKVAEAVSSKLGEGLAGEVEAAEASVGRLAAVIDGKDDGEKTETLRSAVKDAEKAAEEMKDGLDRLSNAVNELSRAALRTRDTALEAFRIGLQKCK
ncbi:protein BPS1, chloroplastic [Elaeis guineensis]|uniref:Protein BPS1, chloroplastic n=1 Tax=Elaeis guineensis var. tenera TaxID=51953 RepID=A0A6I9S1G6_ELAGV|nr:protein BPS1, chloroplastic [Elaeis guineensis]